MVNRIIITVMLGGGLMFHAVALNDIVRHIESFGSKPFYIFDQVVLVEKDVSLFYIFPWTNYTVT